MIHEKDLKYLLEKGISEEKANYQLNQFKEGFPFMDIQKPASVSDGIIRLDEEQKLMFTDQFKNGIDEGISVLKFVPASGAATRMFKDLFEFINADKETQEKLKKSGPINVFLSHIEYFAFSNELQSICNIDFSNAQTVFENGALIVEKLLLEDGLNYGK